MDSDKIKSLTVAMTPAFWDDNHYLLKMQLKTLSTQRDKDFDVFIIDPHYNKRKNIIPELAEYYKLDIKHIPYIPNTRIAKKLDCSIFNAAYCYSQSPRIVRFSCYRFVRDNFTELCNLAENMINVDFYTNNIRPDYNIESQVKRFHDIWNFNGDEINWNLVPNDCNDELAAWTKESDIDTEIVPHPGSCWGNYMIWRDNWLSINGTDEVFSNTDHYEDIVFNARAKRAGFKTKRRKAVMYRLHHQHGAFSQRANKETDVPCKVMCDKCKKTTSVNEGRKLVPHRIFDNELKYFPEDMIVVCNTCGLSSPSTDSTTYCNFVKNNRIYATILPEVKIGRNLQILCEDMDKCGSLESKVEIFNDSWENPRYYQKIA